MVRDKGTPFEWGNLRHRAEARLRERKLAANLPIRDPERAVHELEVHQIELEIQNEELREARLELENMLARYTEIFDFAPIGYVTITLDGVMREINHAAARLLGGARSQLAGKSFGSLVTVAYRAQFSELLRLTLVSEARESCELQLLRLGERPFQAQLMATLLARAEPLVLLTVQELSEQQCRSESGAAKSGMALRASKGGGH